MAEIIDIKERWEGHSGLEVENYIKREFGDKYGHIRLVFDEQTNFYNIEAFASKEDASEYDADPEANAMLRLLNEPIPISTVQGDAYTARLYTTMSNSADIVVVDDSLEVSLNYRAIKITQIGNENAGYRGDVIVQRSTDGSTWTTVGTLPNALPSSEPDDAETLTTVDIGKFLGNGWQMVRLRASYTYTTEDGDTKTVTSSNVVIGASVTKTSLSLSLLTNYETPQNADKGSLELQFRVYGSVRKTFHLEVTGSTGVYKTSKELTASDDNVSVPFSLPEDSAYGLLTHGVKKVRAWMEAEDGLGNTIKSNETVNRIMMVNAQTEGADLLKPYLLMQNVDTEAVNYVQTELAQYAVYIPKENEDGTITNEGDAINVAFLLTDYTEDYETIKPTEYFRVEQLVEPNKTYSLLTTIEIEAKNEAEVITSYDTYFRARRIEDGEDTDFLKESTGEMSYYIKVDNSSAIVPVSGATFLLNPKVRNNTEENPARVLNARANNVEVDSVWTNFGFINDGWVTADDGQKVLRVMAGAKLEIKKNVWAQFLKTPNSSMTFEIDFAVHNVTNLADPIIAMFDGTGMTFRGMRMNALDGWVKTASYSNSDDCLFSWQEGVRTHVSVNVHHQVIPNNGDVQYPSTATNVNGSIALARVLINGDIIREIPFSTTNANEWTTSENGSIIIGNEGADIDIYSLRIYEDKQVEANDILMKNYLASRPTAEEKASEYERNNIMTGGRIDVEKAKSIGINCMVWHGALPYYYNQSEQEGWYEIFRYDDDGNYMPEYSGTICKQTKSLKVKGQGSTAKTYYDWNLQDDQSKVKATIQVALKDIHESIVVGEPYSGELTDDEGNVTYTGMLVDIYGGNLGKNFPLENATQPYPYNNGVVTVPDGWIDGNGKYRGMGYMVMPDTSLAQKKVIKINYASSMQSHLLYACLTYDLLHRKVVGDTPLQKRIPTAVSAKHTSPFMLFHQAEGSGNVFFKGMGNYGAGKMDKVTWGYVKKKHPMFTLIEGSDNNLPMTGFRVPFDKVTAVYSPEGEGWLYNGAQSWDFDAGATTEELTDGWQYQEEGEAPKANIRNKWADIHNFVYLNGTNIKYYNGTFTAFQASASAQDTDYKYWCTQGDKAYILYRYDYLNNKWVDAGLLDESSTTYKVIDLRTYSVTKTAYENSIASGNFATINQAFKDALTAFMKNTLEFFFNKKSLLFNYCFVLQLNAGTDNSDKNTYFKVDPYAIDMADKKDDAFGVWFLENFGHEFNFAEVYQVFMDGDDMDAIFPTDNNSHLTKPYYIERMYPYADDDTTTPLYEGMMNQLFDFVENAYYADHTLAGIMREIMVAATELVSENDKFYGLTSDKKSLWGFFHKYAFNTQYYFPQVAYNEQARIRYEFPQLIGFISQGGGARNITPISQSLGSQLQNELQYMNQRLIYMASYAGFGAFGGMTGYSIGLPDANESFNFTPATMPDGSGADYIFTVKSHQYIYPSYNIGTTFTNTHHRLKPDTAYTFTMAENIKGSDTGMGLLGINYYTDLGDLSDKSITSGTLTINGKRLTRIIVPYKANGPLRPQKVVVEAKNVEEFNFAYANTPTPLDLSALIRAKKIVVAYGPNDIIFPESSVLHLIQVSARITRFSIDNCPQLTTLNTNSASWSNLQYVMVGRGVPRLNTQQFVSDIYTTQKSQSTPVLQSIHVENVDWNDFPIETLEWYANIPKCEFKGKIAIKEESELQNAVTWDIKNKINLKFGNVDDANSADHKGLLLSYLQRQLASANLKGNFYNDGKGEYPFTIEPNTGFANTQTKVAYSIANPQGVDCYIDEQTGVLYVNMSALPEDEATVDVTARISRYYESAYQEDIVLTKAVKVYNRQAELGDLVYADGTYSSVDDWDGSKTPIGVCFYIAPRYKSGDKKGEIVEELFNPKDVQQRLMIALEPVSVTSKAGTSYTTPPWGIYKDQSEDNGIYATVDGTKTYLRLADGSLDETTMYDIPTIVNLGSTGLKVGLINNSASYIEDSNFRDEADTSGYGILNDGFLPIKAGTSCGDGFAWEETAAEEGARTLDSSLALLAGSGYKAGDMVNSGYAKTLKIIAHRNKVLTGSPTAVGLSNPLYTQMPIPAEGSGYTELESLAELLDDITEWASGTLGEAKPNKWQQLYYPAASMAYAYQPTKTLKQGEVLADKFKAHNWFLPTNGLLARIYWHAKLAPNSIFSKAIDKGILTIRASYLHWSCAEYYAATAWYVGFSNGGAGGNNKCGTYLVAEAVAAF